jgi:hypothetical protein
MRQFKKSRGGKGEKMQTDTFLRQASDNPFQEGVRSVLTMIDKEMNPNQMPVWDFLTLEERKLLFEVYLGMGMYWEAVGE